MSKQNFSVASQTEPSADGRVRRSERSRKKIIDAMIDLVNDGNFDPRAQQVAEKAGVGLRSVFRHFDDMDSLFSDGIAQMESDILPIVYAPYISKDWRSRLDEYIDRRAKIFEQIRNAFIFGSIKRYQSAVVAHDANRITKNQRRFLKENLPKEIAADAILFEALDVMMSYESFRKLRVDNGLSAKRTKEVIKEAVGRLVGD